MMRRCLCGWFLLKTSYSPSDHLLNMDEDILEVGVRNDCLKLVTSGRVLFKSLEQEVPFLNPSSQKFYTSLGITSCSVSTMQALSSPPFLFKIWELFSRSLRSHLVKASVEMSFLQPALPRTLHHLGNSQPQVCARAGLQAWICQGKRFL